MRCFDCPDYPDECKDYTETITEGDKVYTVFPCGQRRLEYIIAKKL